MTTAESPLHIYMNEPHLTENKLCLQTFADYSFMCMTGQTGQLQTINDSVALQWVVLRRDRQMGHGTGLKVFT